MHGTSTTRRVLAPLFFAALIADPLAAQTDTSGLGAALRGARAALSGLPELWSLRADSTAWLFVASDLALLAEPASGRNVVTAVTLPPGSPRANMAFPFGGRLVAMVVLPLGRDSVANARLLVHEALHTFQPKDLPHPGRTEPMTGGELLDGADGRAWLFLELRALAAALTDSGAARRRAAADALLFRGRRDALAHPDERARLDALDLAEGIPEYAGWRLTGSTDSLLASRLAASATRRVSWVRAVGYSTGPAYGFVLDALGAPDWRRAWIRGERLPDLLAESLGPDALAGDPEERGLVYDSPTLFTTERQRDETRLRVLDSLRARYVDGAVLRLIPPSLQATFDPNGQVPLGGEGTVMRNFRWSSAEGGELAAPGGALVSRTWSHVQVPLGDAVIPEGTLRAPFVIEASGWKLRLPQGWQVTRVGKAVEVRPPLP